MTEERIPSTPTERKFFDAAIEILAEQGYGSLKIRAICERLGLSTGAFYHSFPGLKEFTAELLEHWRAEQTLRVAELARQQPDELARIEDLIRAALSLSHRAEAAIRVWAGVDAEVASVVHRVDQERLEAVTDAFVSVIGDPVMSARMAQTALYLLIGYEQSLVPEEPDTSTLEWAFRLLQLRASDPHSPNPPLQSGTVTDAG